MRFGRRGEERTKKAEIDCYWNACFIFSIPGEHEDLPWPRIGARMGLQASHQLAYVCSSFFFSCIAFALGGAVS